MAFAAKSWQDSPSTSTPLSATALIDLETRLSAYTDGTTPTGLTDASTITVDASLNSNFRVTLGGNRTLGNPSNARDGQMIVFELKQDVTGTRVLTLDTKYKFGTDITTVVLSTAAGTVDVLAVRYNTSQDRFWVVSFIRGF